MPAQRRVTGLTLIEVLIALAIISIALTAIIKAASQNIRGTSHLQEKTVALWVGQQVMNEVRAGLLKLPAAPDKLEESTDMLGRHWQWQAGEDDTPNKHIKKLSVNVYSGTNAADQEQTPIITLESYRYNEDTQA